MEYNDENSNRKDEKTGYERDITTKMTTTSGENLGVSRKAGSGAQNYSPPLLGSRTILCGHYSNP